MNDVVAGILFFFVEPAILMGIGYYLGRAGDRAVIKVGKKIALDNKIGLPLFRGKVTSVTCDRTLHGPNTMRIECSDRITEIVD